MDELERSLVSLGGELAFPPTPELASRVGASLAEPTRPRRWTTRRALVLALAVVVLALAAAFAVPSARTSILRFFHLRGATIERVETLPPATGRLLTAQLGTPASEALVRRVVSFAPLVPPGTTPRRFYLRGDFVSTIVGKSPPVLLTEFRFGRGEGIIKKYMSPASRVEPVVIGGEQGFWLVGAEHVVYLPSLPARYAGNVLLWQRGDLTLRLEGQISKAEALRIARSLR
jgi:hypothetical protein